jgi:GcrA cell cycle regulator
MTNQHNGFWSAARDSELATLWDKGLSASAIAADHFHGRVTRSAVIGRAHRLGLAKRASPIRARDSGSRPRSRRGDDAAAVEARQRATAERDRHLALPALYDAPAGDGAAGDAAPPAAIRVDARPAAPLARAVEADPARQHPFHAAYPAAPDYSIRDCQWLHGDPKAADFHFCGGATVPGAPYCAPHLRRAVKPAGTRESNAPAGGVAAGGSVGWGK